eukprot:6633000-Pyramimonas_sp.AAC.1
MSGAAAAALPGEATDLSEIVFSKGGKGGSKDPLGRLSDRVNAAKAALARSPGGTPEQKKSRTEDIMDGLMDSVEEFHPAPAFPGIGNGRAEPSTVASAAVAPGIGPSGSSSGARKGPLGNMH